MIRFCEDKNEIIPLWQEAFGDTEEEIESTLDYIGQSGNADGTTRAQHLNMQISSASHGTTDIEVTVPMDTDELCNFIVFKERIGQIPVSLDDDSVILTEKMARMLDVGPGDEITLFDQDEIGNPTGKGYTLKVTGVVEYYVGHVLFIGKDAWHDCVGTDLDYTAIYANCTEDETERELFTEELHDRPEVETVTYNDETIDTYRKMLSSVNMIVVVLVVAAAALAFIVLYNLTNINITERLREIATIKVLGFYKAETAMYVFRENMLLTVVGAVAGIPLGILLHKFVMSQIQVDMVFFNIHVGTRSFVMSMIYTFIFAVLVDLVMIRRLERINMAESMKSIE